MGRDRRRETAAAADSPDREFRILHNIMFCFTIARYEADQGFETIIILGIHYYYITLRVLAMVSVDHRVLRL